MKTIIIDKNTILKALGKKFSLSNTFNLDDSEFWKNSVDSNNQTPLMYIIQYNSAEELNLTREELIATIEKSDLNAQGWNGKTASMYILDLHKSQKIPLSQSDILDLISLSDLNIKDESGSTLLTYILKNNKSQNLNLSHKEIKDIIQKSDITIVDKNGTNVLMHVLKNYKQQHLDLEPIDILSLIDQSNLTQSDIAGNTALSYILTYNISYNLNFSKEYLLELISRTFPELGVILNQNKQNTPYEETAEASPATAVTKLSNFLDESDDTQPIHPNNPNALELRKWDSNIENKDDDWGGDILGNNPSPQKQDHNTDAHIEGINANSLNQAEQQLQQYNKKIKVMNKLVSTQSKKLRNIKPGFETLKTYNGDTYSIHKKYNQETYNKLSTKYETKASKSKNIKSTKPDLTQNNKPKENKKGNKNNTPLIALANIFERNADQDLNLEREDIIKIMRYINTQEPKNNIFFYLLKNNKSQNLNLTRDDIVDILNNADLSVENREWENALILCLKNNKPQELGLTPQDIMDVIKKSNLNFLDRGTHNTPLIYILEHNSYDNLNLSREDILYIVTHSDLNIKNSIGSSPLIEILKYNTSSNLNLTYRDIYIILDKEINKLADDRTPPELMIEIVNLIRANPSVLDQVIDVDIGETVDTKKIMERVVGNVFNLQNNISDLNHKTAPNTAKNTHGHTIDDEDRAINKIKNAAERLKNARMPLYGIKNNKIN